MRKPSPGSEGSAMKAALVPTFIDMPGWRPILKRIGTNMALVSFIPMAVFYTFLATFGLRVAVVSVVSWYYGMALLNIVRRKPVLAAGLLGAGVISIRAVVTFITGSAFLFFLQPVAGTVFTATLIAATALAGRPILDRIAHDFCAFSPEMSARLRDNKFFFRISVLWSVTYFLNAAGTVWLLTNASLNRFMVLKIGRHARNHCRHCRRVVGGVPVDGPARERLDPLGQSPIVGRGLGVPGRGDDPLEINRLSS
jgi:hypothetical protein